MMLLLCVHVFFFVCEKLFGMYSCIIKIQMCQIKINFAKALALPFCIVPEICSIVQR